MPVRPEDPGMTESVSIEAIHLQLITIADILSGSAEKMVQNAAMTLRTTAGELIRDTSTVQNCNHETMITNVTHLSAVPDEIANNGHIVWREDEESLVRSSASYQEAQRLYELRFGTRRSANGVMIKWMKLNREGAILLPGSAVSVHDPDNPNTDGKHGIILNFADDRQTAIVRFGSNPATVQIAVSKLRAAGDPT